MSRVCSCAGGGTGSQTCLGGSYSPCVCLLADVGASDSGSAPDTGPSTDTGLPDVAPSCPGGSGCPCTTNADCQNNLCIEDLTIAGGKVCAQTCVENCPTGFNCAQVTTASGDVVSICINPTGRLCEPCSASKDCASLGLTDSQCVDQGALGRFCGIACTGDSGCPSEYACQEVSTVEGGKLKQCVRKADSQQTPFGVCPCSPVATQKKLATTCFVEVKDVGGQVVGKCPGQRVCGPEGLSACSAPPAQAEVCNGQDDDCDGQTDEATCDDGKPCTKDVCDGKNGCQHSPLDGAPCDADGSVCSEGDSCQAGVCVAGKAKDCDDKNPCTKDSCDLTQGGKCLFTKKKTGTPCDDGSACTNGDACADGQCEGAQLDCDDGNACTNDSCDKAKGCVNTPNSAACSDGNACTSDDTCGGGTCAGQAVACDDKDPCTTDSCDPAAGCVKAPLAACNMVFLVGGSFQMGSEGGKPDEVPVHKVTLAPYWIDSTEVTVAAYANFVKAGKCKEPDGPQVYKANNWGVFGHEQYPVNSVDWLDATSYCAWAGKRLPTEAEWEYAARSGGKVQTYPWGNETATCARVVMAEEDGFYGCGGQSTAKVCSKPAGNSAQAICDLAGNVWEWVSDWYGAYPASDQVDPTGPATGKERVFRGGSFQNPAPELRATMRNQNSPMARSDGTGFRCAKSVP